MSAGVKRRDGGIVLTKEKVKRGKVDQKESTVETPSAEGGSILRSLKDSSYRVRWLVDSYEPTVYPQQAIDEFDGDEHMLDFDQCQFRLRADALNDVSETLERLKITDVAVMMSEEVNKKQDRELDSSIKGMKDALSFSKNLSHTKANMIAEKINRLQRGHDAKMKAQKDDLRKRSKVDDLIERNRLHQLENEELKKKLNEKKAYIDMKSRQKVKKSLDQLREEFEEIADREQLQLENLLVKKKAACDTVASGQAKRSLKLKELQAQLTHTISNYGKNVSSNNAKSTTHYSNALVVATKVPVAPTSRPSSKAYTAPSRPVSGSSRPRTTDGQVDSVEAPEEESDFVLGKNSLGDRIAKREKEVLGLRAAIEDTKLRRTGIEAEVQRCSDIVVEVRQTITKAALSERVQEVARGQQKVADLKQRLADNQLLIEEIERELAEPMPNFLEEERVRLEQERQEEERRLAEEAERLRLAQEEEDRLAEIARLEEEKQLAEEAELLRALQEAATKELSVSFEASETALRRRRNEPVYIENIVRTVRSEHLTLISTRMLRLILTARNQPSAEEAAEAEEGEEGVYMDMPSVVPSPVGQTAPMVTSLPAHTEAPTNAVAAAPVDRHAAKHHPHAAEEHHPHYVAHMPDHHQDPQHVHAHPGVHHSSQALGAIAAMHPPVRPSDHPTAPTAASIPGTAGALQVPDIASSSSPGDTAAVTSTVESAASAAGHSSPAPVAVTVVTPAVTVAPAVGDAESTIVQTIPVEAAQTTDRAPAAHAPVGTQEGAALPSAPQTSAPAPAAVPTSGIAAPPALSADSSAPVPAPGARKAVKALKALVSTRMFLKYTAKPATPEPGPSVTGSTGPGTAASRCSTRAGTADPESDEEFCDPSQDFGLVLAKEHLENVLSVLRPTKLMAQHNRILDNLRESVRRTEESLVGVLKDNALLKKDSMDVEKDTRRHAAQLTILRRRFLKVLDGLCGLPVNISLTDEELQALRDKVSELSKAELHWEEKIRVKREHLYLEAVEPIGKQKEPAIAVPRVGSDHSMLTDSSSASLHSAKKKRAKRPRAEAPAAEDSQSQRQDTEKEKEKEKDVGSGTLLDAYKSRTMLREVIPTPANDAPQRRSEKEAASTDAHAEDYLPRSGSAATLQSSVSDITSGSSVFRHFGDSGDFVPLATRVGWGVSADPGALRQDDIIQQYRSETGGGRARSSKGERSPTPKLSSAEAEAEELARAYGGGTVQLDCRSPEEIARSADMGILHKLNYYYQLKQDQVRDFRARVKAQQMRLQPRDTEFYQRVPKVVNTPTVQFSLHAEPERFFPYNANTWFAKEASRTRSPAVQTLDTKEQVFTGTGGYGPDGLYHEFGAGASQPRTAEPTSPTAGGIHPQPWRITFGRASSTSPTRTRSGQGPRSATQHLVRTDMDVDGLGLVPRPPSGTAATIVGADVRGGRALTPGRGLRERREGDVTVDIGFDASAGNGNYPPLNDEHVEFANSFIQVHQYLAPRGNIAEPPSERRRLENNMKYARHGGFAAFGSFPPMEKPSKTLLHLPSLSAELVEEVEAEAEAPVEEKSAVEVVGVASVPTEESQEEEDQTHTTLNYYPQTTVVDGGPASGPTAPSTGARSSANPFDHIAKNIEKSAKKHVQFPTAVATTLAAAPQGDLAYLDPDGRVVDEERPRSWERPEGISSVSAAQIIDSYNPAIGAPQPRAMKPVGVAKPVQAVEAVGAGTPSVASGAGLDEASTASDRLAASQMQMNEIVDQHLVNLGAVSEDEEVAVEGEEEGTRGGRRLVMPKHTSRRDPVIALKLEAFEPLAQYDPSHNVDTLQQHYSVSPSKARGARFVQKAAWGVKKPLLSALHARTSYAVSRGFSRAATGLSGREMTEEELDDELEALRGIYREYAQDEAVFGPDSRGRGSGFVGDVSDALYGMPLRGTTRHAAHQRGRTIVVKKNPCAEDAHHSAYCYDASALGAGRVEGAASGTSSVPGGRGTGVGVDVGVSTGASRIVSEGVAASGSLVVPAVAPGGGLVLDGTGLDAYNSKGGTAAGASTSTVLDGVGTPASQKQSDKSRVKGEREPTGQVAAEEIVGLQVVAAGVVGERKEVFAGPMGDSDEEDDLPVAGAPSTNKTFSVTLPSIVPASMEGGLDDIYFEDFS